MTNGSCFWLDASAPACSKAAWPSCGYSWLVSAPVSLLWGVWLVYGLGRLRQATRVTNGFQFDTDKIHDPLAQGMAVALSQRKSTSLHKPKFQRYMKLGAMWAEWPSLTYTPLTIAFKVRGSSSFLSSMLVSFNSPYELANLGLAVACGGSILALRHGQRLVPLYDLYLKKYAYPITFDVLYIPLISTFVRLATCPAGYQHIALPGGATCDCVNRFGISWSIGLAGFVVLYTSALHYKMFIEPHGATMDFRFQTSFQIIMVMARTLNPIVSVLVSDLDMKTHRTDAILLACGFLACIAFLFVYNYKAQPCIGSGRIPNNIRALSFSSAIYTTLCVLGLLVSDAATAQLYYALTPLPIVWVVAWRRNNRRARHFHVPDLSILELLRDHSSRAKTVGTIAALYMDPQKLHIVHYAAIVAQLEKITQRSRAKELLCRAYALRTLWFCHIENFRKQNLTVGEDRKQTAVPPKLWFKDIENIDRKSKARSRLLLGDVPLSIIKQSIKIQRVHLVKDVVDATSSLANLHPRQINALAAFQRLTPMLRTPRVAPVRSMDAKSGHSRRDKATQRSSTSALEMPRVKRRPLRLSEPDTLPSSLESRAIKPSSTETPSTLSTEIHPTETPPIEKATPQSPMLGALQEAARRPSSLRNVFSGQRTASSNTSMRHLPSVSDLRRPSGWKHTMSMAKLVAPILSRLTGTSRSIALSNYHVVLIHDKHWISKDESPDDALFHSIGLFNTALEVLAQACALGDKPCMHEIAVFLLEWYRSGYLRLPKSVYLHVLSTLTATADRKRSADAIHTIHKLCTNRVLPLQLWLKNASYLNNFVTALSHPSPTTVFKCASVLALVLQAAERHTKTSLFLLLTPESINRVHGALAKWHSVYHLSATLEAICLRLHQMEVAQFTKRLHPGKKKLSDALMQWVHETFTQRFVRVVVRSADSVRPLTLTSNTVTSTLTRRKTESHLSSSSGIRRFSRSIVRTSMTVKITPAHRTSQELWTPEHTPPASEPRRDANIDDNRPPQVPPYVEPLIASSLLLPPALPPEVDEQVEMGHGLAPVALRANRSGPRDMSDLLAPTTPPPPRIDETSVGPPQELVTTSDLASNAGVDGSEGLTSKALTVAAILASATQELPLPVGVPWSGPHIALLHTPTTDVAAPSCGPPTAALVDGPSPLSSFTDPSRKSDSVRLGSRLSGTPACDTRTSSIDDDASLELLASRNQSFYTVDLLLDDDGKTPTSARRHADATSRRIMRPDQYVVVSPAVLTEIRRRRTSRRRLLEALRHAQKVHRDTKLMLASKKELTDALANVAVSYRSATESAIIDFVKVGLDPDLHKFFTSVVKPVLTPSDHKVHEKRRSVLWLPPPT